MQAQRPVMRQEQRLKMTPQLYQAIRIMSLPLQELKTSIQEELEKNPALEVVEDNSTMSLDDVETKGQEESYEYFDDSSDIGYIRSQSDSQEDTKRKFLEGAISQPETLHEHLMWQLRLQPLGKREFEIGEVLINNLDDNGFHIEPPEAFVSEGELQMLQQVIEMVQIFDPVGVCTKNYRESLLVQIENHPYALPHAYELASEHLELLEREKFAEIARKMKIPEDDVRLIREFIRTLEPFPGRSFSSKLPAYVVPDVSVRLQEGEFRIEVNDGELPVLGINPFFTHLMADKKSQKKELKRYIHTNIQGAKWFMRSIRQRNETLLKVTVAIVDFQRDFFRKGAKYLVPLTLRDIAKEIGVHEATVSRTTNGKYAETEWGIFELKYFFTNSISGSGSSGSRHSKEGVKQEIKEIIENEGNDGHLSDKRIAEILEKKGISLARRTVAKYRKELDIMSSYGR